MNGAGIAEGQTLGMQTATEQPMELDQAAIAERAYGIYLNRLETGQDALSEDDWYQAVRELTESV